MSGLADRLNRLRQHAPDLLNKRVNDHQMQNQRCSWADIQAEEMTREWGKFVIRERRFSLSYYHGDVQLGQLIREGQEFTGFDHKHSVPISPEKLVFMDTETTGLGVGAGNVPFMVAMGYYSGEEFIVQQLFIRNPAEEAAMLYYLREKLSFFSHIVTYNGRTFDWPVLKNRYIIHRIPFAEENLVQVDLLYPSRSLWKQSLPSCRLGKVEEARLGFFRDEDVPGSMAPALYFQYLATGDVKAMEGVFIHNEYDILSLAGLAVHLSDLLAGHVYYDTMQCEELFRLGIWYEKLGKPHLMDKTWNVLRSRPLKASGTYLAPMANMYKKRKNMSLAVELWKLAIDSGRSEPALHALDPIVELAMYFEHQKKDYHTAFIYADKALQMARRRILLCRGSLKLRAEVEALQKRLERLKRKSENHRAQQQLPVLF